MYVPEEYWNDLQVKINKKWWFKEVVEAKLPFCTPFSGSSLTGLCNFTNASLICRLYKRAGFLKHLPHVFFFFLQLDLITSRTDYIFSFFKNSF